MRGIAGGIWAPVGDFIGRSEVQVVAVCDVNARNRDNAHNIVNTKYGNSDCEAYNDFRELLARPDIDALLIATGDRWHPLVSIAAAKAGEDMYCEKPISATIEEAKAMCKAMGRHGAAFQMAEVVVPRALFREILGRIHQGEAPEFYREFTFPVNRRRFIIVSCSEAGRKVYSLFGN